MAANTVLDGPATEATVKFLDSLLFERADITLADVPEDRRPQTQRAASAWIDDLKSREALPVVDEQIERIQALAAQMGETYEMPSDRASANRIIHSLTRRLNAREYHAAKSEATDVLNELIGSPADDVPFD